MMNGKTGTRGGRDILAQEELFVSDEIEYPAPKGLAKTVQQEKASSCCDADTEGYLRCVSTVKKEEIMTFKERFQARECSFNMIEDWIELWHTWDIKMALPAFLGLSEEEYGVLLVEGYDALARRLNTDAEILLLDNPTQGIDVGAKAEIYKLILELAKQGKTILINTLEIPEIQKVADYCAVFYNGEIIKILEHQEIDEMTVMMYSTNAAQAEEGK